MITIPQMLGFPNGTPVEKTQVKVASVYDRKTVQGKDGPTGCQSAILTDIGGNKIRVTVWGHDDISMYKDKEVVIEGRNGKGVTVKHGSYMSKTTGQPVNTVELSVSKTGTISPVEVYKAQNPGAGVQTQLPGQNVPNAAQSGSVGPSSVHGAKVGMAINNAVLIMTNQGIEYSAKNLAKLAQEIIEVSTALEAGKVNPPAPKAEAQPSAAPSVPPQEGNDEDVPF